MNPIPLETLQRFCSKDTNRPNLNQPVNCGAYCYASDGRVIIRTDRHPLCLEGANTPNFEAVLKDECDGNFMPLPTEPPEGWGTPCGACGGTGGIKCQCHCGSQHVRQCDDCDGLGKVYQQPRNIVNVGQSRVQAQFLVRIAKLPNPLIACGKNPIDPLHIKFDGGIGRLMPVKLE